MGTLSVREPDPLPLFEAPEHDRCCQAAQKPLENAFDNEWHGTCISWNRKW